MSVDDNKETKIEEKKQKFDEPPGPEGISEWFNDIWGLQSDPITNFENLRKKYGDFVQFYNPALRKQAFLLSDPDYVEHVLHTNQDQYVKDDTNDYLSLVLGEGLLTSEGDRWLEHRRLMAPMFHRKSIKNFVRIMIEDTREMLDQWEEDYDDGEPFDLASEIREVTLDIVGRCLFSTPLKELGEDVGQAVKIVQRFIDSRIRSLINLPVWVPLPSHREFIEARDSLREIVTDLVESRKGSADEYNDFLSMLMLAEDEETGEKMSKKEIYDEVMTFVLAGHETTSNAVTWTCYLLSKHPDIENNFHDRMNHTEDLKKNPFEYFEENSYAKQVVEEGMRVYPPVWMIGRKPIEDDQVGPYELPEGSMTLIPIYILHHHPDLWDKPEEFKPERFHPDSPEPRHKYAYIPFGAGRRICIGREFAMMEAQIMMTMINQRYRLELEQSEPIEYEALVTLQPKHGIKMSVSEWD